MTTHSAPAAVDPVRSATRRVQRPGRGAYLMSSALGVAAASAAALTLLFPSVISGVVGANGNLRGTAAVVLSVGVPVLAAALYLSRRGSTRAFVVWLGSLGYLVYQAVLFCFATPLNSFFLLYVAYLGLAVWSIVFLVRGTDLSAFGASVSTRAPIRAVAGFALVVTLANAIAWLKDAVPAVLSEDPRAFLAGTGLLTNPVYIQDLAVWLPLLATAGVAAWRRRVWGQLAVAAMLTMFVLESLTISADQYVGSRADPTNAGSSITMVPVFAAFALVTAVPLIAFLRHVDRARP
jgi:hypothetical protein